MDDFDSSDFEMPETSFPFPTAGRLSIASMNLTRNPDRINSKKESRLLTNTHDAPGTVRRRWLWYNRFAEWRGIAKDDTLSPPTCEDLERFVRVVVKHIKAQSDDKPAPSSRTLQGGIGSLVAHLRFQYPRTFTLTTGEDLRIVQTIRELEEAGALFTGQWRIKQWLTFNVIEKLTESFLSKAVTEGTGSWDIVVNKMLTSTLQQALDCRAGEIVRSHEYKGEEYMCWKHIELTVEGEPTFNNLRVKVTIAYEKAFKKDTKNDRHRFFRPLRPAYQCSIHWLVIQALRNGHFLNADSLDLALRLASRRTDQRVLWAHPTQPVISTNRFRPALNFDYPPYIDQPNSTIKEMALTAGLIGSVISHNIRSGGARDLAHMAKRMNGVANDITAKGLGHTASTKAHGVTDHYVGPINEDVVNRKSELEYHDRSAPLFGQPLTSHRNRKADIDAWCEANGLDKNKGSDRRTAGKKIKKQTFQVWIDDAKATPPILDQRKIMAERRVNAVTRQQSSALALKDDNSRIPSTPIRQERNETKSPQRKSKRQKGKAKEGDIDCRLIDPAILDRANSSSDEETINNDEAFRPLADLFFGGEDQDVDAYDLDDDDIDDMAERALLLQIPVSNEVAARDPLLLVEEAFVDYFSKINTTNSGSFGRSRLDGLAREFPTGNTRDEPTRFTFRCDRCGFENHKTTEFGYHMIRCKQREDSVQEEPKVKPFPCPYDGCTSSLSTKSSLNVHINEVHIATPHPCPYDGCTSMPATKKCLESHIKYKHSSKEFACEQPGCEDLIPFKAQGGLRDHQVNVHTAMGKAYIPTKCLFPGCQSKPVDFKHLTSYYGHLYMLHGLGKSKANKFMPSNVDE